MNEPLTVCGKAGKFNKLALLLETIKKKLSVCYKYLNDISEVIFFSYIK